MSDQKFTIEQIERNYNSNWDLMKINLMSPHYFKTKQGSKGDRFCEICEEYITHPIHTQHATEE